MLSWLVFFYMSRSNYCILQCVHNAVISEVEYYSLMHINYDRYVTPMKKIIVFKVIQYGILYKDFHINIFINSFLFFVCVRM